MGLRNGLKRIGLLKFLYNYYTSFVKTHFRFALFKFIYRNYWYWKDYLTYKGLKKNSEFRFALADAKPCTEDKTTTTPLDPIYFYQDSWLAKKIFQNKPSHHFDVGSNAKAIALISQFVPVTMIDIRPIQLKLDNLTFKEGSLLQLPFDENSIESISSVCVAEHVGLGRYGDPLDSFGSEKSFHELQRVTKSGGLIYITVPVDDGNKILFNDCRTFTPQYIHSLFNDCRLLEEKYIYGTQLLQNYIPENGWGVGMYCYRKN